MPLLKLIAEGVGPFEHLEIDLSNGEGEPHLGPHVLAGVNGSGKSTILRTIAWVLDRGRGGFQYDEWHEMLKGHRHSRALLVVQAPRGPAGIWACSKGTSIETVVELDGWIRSASVMSKLGSIAHIIPKDERQARYQRLLLRQTDSDLHDLDPNANTVWLSFPHEGQRLDPSGRLFNYAAYSPSKALRHLANPDLAKVLPDSDQNCLAFDGSVQNDAIQSWLLSLYSKRAIARERRQSGDEYSRALGRFEAALGLIYDQRVTFDVEIEPRFQPRLKMMGHSLNFSQLPDGVRSTVAWVADFMMREDSCRWSPSLNGRRPGVVLLDEVDAHLHPFWQRRLLPAMREALPDVQIIATSHSPFVISSCPEARVHVLELDADGHARARPPVDSPIGETVTTTLREIFGVQSRFDVQTERELNEWNELKKRESTRSLSGKESARLNELTVLLSERSEELRSLVAAPRALPKSVVTSLLKGTTAQPAASKKRKGA